MALFDERAMIDSVLKQQSAVWLKVLADDGRDVADGAHGVRVASG